MTNGDAGAGSPPSPPPLRPGRVEEFRYEAQGATGEALRGTLEARSAVEARARLAGLNLRVLAVEPLSQEGGKSGRRARRGGLPLEDFQLLNQQLAHLIAAGMPMERGLRLIAADLRSGRLAAAANGVAAELEKGVPLKEAFAHHSSRFPRLYGELIEAGVETANLPAMLFNLGRHLEMLSRLRRALWRAFAYPLAMCAGLAGVLLFISVAIVPQFHQIYADFQTTLPLLTQWLLAAGDVYPAILLGVVVFGALMVAGVLVLRGTGRLGAVVDSVGMRVPVIGPVLRASAVARWCDALRVAVEAGADLPRGMMLASEVTGSPRASRDGRALSEALSAGRGLRDVPRSLLPGTIPAAMEMAGHAGDLSTSLGTLSHLYERQVEERLRLIPGVITPLMMLVVGMFVALCVLAMFLPLVNLVQAVSG